MGRGGFATAGRIVFSVLWVMEWVDWTGTSSLFLFVSENRIPIYTGYI